MEFDEGRSKEYKLDIKNESPVTYGKKHVYRTNFRAEIPLIISKATGEIDIIDGKNCDVPNERKWFTYLNDFNGVYGIKLVTTLDPSKLGSDNPKSECVLAPEEFKYGIYGTMFEDVPGLDIIDDWDN